MTESETVILIRMLFDADRRASKWFLHMVFALLVFILAFLAFAITSWLGEGLYTAAGLWCAYSMYQTIQARLLILDINRQIKALR